MRRLDGDHCKSKTFSTFITTCATTTTINKGRLIGYLIANGKSGATTCF
jgi:hypothetical protein